MPVNYVSVWDAMRFANWLHNGQGNGDTETGAYTLLGGTPAPSNRGTLKRNAGATVFLTSVHEWHKAAYYDAGSASYVDYPAGSDTPSTCASPTATANSANCGAAAANDLTSVGSYPGSPSAYGTFDQGGNVFEWSTPDPEGQSSFFSARGGSFHNDATFMAASYLSGTSGGFEGQDQGFRVASTLPEPDPGWIVMIGILTSALAKDRLRR